MVTVLECLQETWLNDLIIGLVVYVGFSLILIIILLVILFKILNKNKSQEASNVNNQELKGGSQ